MSTTYALIPNNCLKCKLINFHTGKGGIVSKKGFITKTNFDGDDAVLYEYLGKFSARIAAIFNVMALGKLF